MLKNKDIVENQQKIITQLDNQLQKKLMTIDYLTEQLTYKNTNSHITSVDLLGLHP